jgi:hypothetical protein
LILNLKSRVEINTVMERERESTCEGYPCPVVLIKISSGGGGGWQGPGPSKKMFFHISQLFPYKYL